MSRQLSVQARIVANRWWPLLSWASHGTGRGKKAPRHRRAVGYLASVAIEAEMALWRFMR